MSNGHLDGKVNKQKIRILTRRTIYNILSAASPLNTNTIKYINK